MVNLKSTIIVLFIFLSLHASAELPGLTSAYMNHIITTRNLIASQNLMDGLMPSTCHRQILNIAKDRIIKITFAFGYMDVSNGQDFNDSAHSIYKIGDVLDINAKNALENILLSKCQGQISKVCGFKRKGLVLTKTVRDRFSGNKLTIQMNLINSAVSASNIKNQSQLADQQNIKSKISEEQFLNSILSDDVVIYLGHARSGGGPDFYPPVLKANGAVDYGYYRKNRDGIKKLTHYLKHSPNPLPMLGLLACKSTGLFATSVRSVSPHTLQITAGELFDYNDILPTGFAILEAIINQRCTEAFEKIIKVQPKSQSFINIYF